MKVTAKTKKTYTVELEMSGEDLGWFEQAVRRAGQGMTNEEPSMKRVRNAILDCIASARTTTVDSVTINRPKPKSESDNYSYTT